MQMTFFRQLGKKVPFFSWVELGKDFQLGLVTLDLHICTFSRAHPVQGMGEGAYAPTGVFS